MAKSCKYSVNTSVSWGEILSIYRWRIGVVNKDGLYFVKCYTEDFKHNYPDFVAYDRARAVETAKRVLKLYDVLNELRRFLRYKTLSYADLGIAELIEFYNEHKDEVSENDFHLPKENKYCYPE